MNSKTFLLIFHKCIRCAAQQNSLVKAFLMKEAYVCFPKKKKKLIIIKYVTLLSSMQKLKMKTNIISRNIIDDGQKRCQRLIHRTAI